MTIMWTNSSQLIALSTSLFICGAISCAPWPNLTDQYKIELSESEVAAAGSDPSTPCPQAPPGVPPKLVLYNVGEPRPMPDSATAVGLGASKTWFRERRAMVFMGFEYVPFGWYYTIHAPLMSSPGAEVIYCGEHDGVPIYALPPFAPYASDIFIQVNHSGLFSPYVEVSEVR